MKKIIYAVILMALTSCNQFKSNKTIADNAACDSIMAESHQTNNDTIEPFQTQAEINEACYNEYVANEDSVENEFQKLLEAFPQYRKEFLKEKVAWEKYQEAVHEVQYVKIMVVLPPCMLVQSSLREHKFEVCHNTTCTFMPKGKTFPTVRRYSLLK